jgi:hypothetical protein
VSLEKVHSKGKHVLLGTTNVEARAFLAFGT